MLGGHPCPSPLSRPPAATADIGAGDMREAVAHGAEGSDEMPKPRAARAPAPAARGGRGSRQAGRLTFRPASRVASSARW